MESHNLKAFVGIVSVAPILFLIGFAISFGIYLIWPISLVHSIGATNILAIIGGVLIILGTALAFAAQKQSRVVSKPDYKVTSVDDLMRGPYAYSRHPGSLAIMIMYVGFVLVINSFILVFVAIAFLLLMTFVFTPMEERVIAGLTPGPYAEYRTKVRMWF